MFGVRNLTGERWGPGLLPATFKLQVTWKLKKIWRWHILTPFSILLPYFRLSSLTWLKAVISESFSFCHTAPPKDVSQCFKNSQASPLPTSIIPNFLTHCSLCYLPPNTPAITLCISLSTGCLCLCTYFFFLEQSLLFLQKNCYWSSTKMSIFNSLVK